VSELSDMGCEEFAASVAELALGVLTGRERAEALAHLDRCDACRENVRQLTMTGEELLGLLPAAEPPSGFENRVMQRLNLEPPVFESAAGPASERAEPEGARRELASQKKASRRLWGGLVGRSRRMLTAAAVLVAVIAAGLGGWGMRAATTSPAKSPMSSAEMLTASHDSVGEIYYHGGSSQWLYMSVDMDWGNGTVICQVVGQDGHVTTLGHFWVVDGYGNWGSPYPAGNGALASARLVSTNGTVLATATFAH
jgi:hypothetical protein